MSVSGIEKKTTSPMVVLPEEPSFESSLPEKIFKSSEDIEEIKAVYPFSNETLITLSDIATAFFKENVAEAINSGSCPPIKKNEFEHVLISAAYHGSYELVSQLTHCYLYSEACLFQAFIYSLRNPPTTLFFLMQFPGFNQILKSEDYLKQALMYVVKNNHSNAFQTLMTRKEFQLVVTTHFQKALQKAKEKYSMDIVNILTKL